MARKSRPYNLVDLAAAKKLPLDWLRSHCDLRELDNGAIGIPYLDETGAELFVRRRNPPGKNPRFVQPKGIKLIPYGLNRLEDANKAASVYLCEGESDTWTLWHCDLPALGLPGAGTTEALQPDHVEGITDIYLPADNDDSGESFVETVRKRLSELRYVGRLWRIQVPKLQTVRVTDKQGREKSIWVYKDVSDWYVAAGDKGKFRNELATAVQAAVLLHVEARKPSRNGITTDSLSSANPCGIDKPEKKSVATRLVKLAIETGATWFHDAEYKAFATIRVGDHVETLALRSAAFKRWLGQLLHAEEGRAAGNQAVQDAIASLEAKAHFEGEEHTVHVRLAEHGGKIYLDLADKYWQVCEVDADGWRVVDAPPVRFRRPKGLLPLPLPEPGGHLDELRRFVNVANDADWRLLIACMLAALRPRGPYPILCFYGQQGSAKSTAAKMVRLLIDPSLALLRSGPKDLRDLVIAANNSWLLTYDNLSTIPSWFSDGLCCLSTGSGFSTRELYANDEETIFAATRPIILTSIEDVATRGDLLDRAVLLNLPEIPDEKRVPEQILWRNFEAARPPILGALLTALSGALRELPNVQLACLPRMADFASFGTAVERAMGWPCGLFLDAYSDNRSGANETALEASPLVPFLRQFIEANGAWTGTASELLKELKELAGDVAKSKDWPGNGRALSGRLKRLAPNLRSVGIFVEWDREQNRNRTRIIRLTSQQDKGRDFASDASVAPKDAKNLEVNGIASDAGGRKPALSDANADANQHAKTARQDVTDATDAKSRRLSYLAPGCTPEDAMTPFDEESNPRAT